MREVQDLKNFDWDDTELVRAYNRGLKNKTKREQHGAVPKENKMSLIKKWKVGSNCSAKYSGDGLYYEAKITRLNGDFCTVEFWGYNDTENVALQDLEESAGKRARKKQIKDSASAAIANMPSSSGEESLQQESEAESTIASVCGYPAKDVGKGRHDNRTVKKNEVYYVQQEAYGYSAPAPDHAVVPPSGPYTQVPGTYYTAPPAQTLPPLSDEMAHLAPMLMAWYWAGYYTGQESKSRSQSLESRNCPRSHRCCCHD